MSCCTSGLAMSRSTAGAVLVRDIELAGHSTRSQQPRQYAWVEADDTNHLADACGAVATEQAGNDIDSPARVLSPISPVTPARRKRRIDAGSARRN